MRLLVIGQQSSQITIAIDIAKSKNAHVVFIENIDEGLEYLRDAKGAELVLFDAKLDIASFINQLKTEHINVPVVGYGIGKSPKEAVATIKAGAKDFIPLPPDEKLIAALFTTLTAQNNKPLVYKSQVMTGVISMVDRVAKSDAHILITGESGTGKEVIASYVHHNSKRASKPFVRVNCAAIPEQLLESELFGYEKGAFTGAMARRIGKFEESSDGTLLLDEISEMDFRLQAKLLRAIQEQEIDRVGGDKPIKVNLRIIATSNRNLPDEVRKGKFREDLYFRLNVINVELPTLKERKEDLESLAEFFIEKYSKANGVVVKKLSKDAIKALHEHNWPGNIRELENSIHRAVLLCASDSIESEDLKILPYKKEPALKNGIDGYLSNNDLSTLIQLSIASLQEKINQMENERK